MGDGEWNRLLDRQCGVVSRQQALGFLSPRVADRHVSSGRWRVQARGVYITHTGPVTDAARSWVASLVAGGGTPGLLGGAAALVLLGLRRFEPVSTDVVVPSGRRVSHPPPYVRVHRTRQLPSSDVIVAAPPCTSAARSLVDAATWARTDREARTVIAMAFQQRLVDGDAVTAVLDRFPTAPRHLLMAHTVADARTGSETVGELDLVDLCREYGLPIPTRQAFRADAAGRRRYLDACFDPWRVRVEVDGGHHMDIDEWWRDMERHNDLATPGETSLRFSTWMVRGCRPATAATIRRALVDHGWRP